MGINEIQRLNYELLKTRKELDKRYQDLQQIYNIVNIIHSTLNFAELSQIARNILENFLNLKTYCFMVYDGVQKRFVYEKTRNLPRNIRKRVLTVAEQSLQGWAEEKQSELVKPKDLPDNLSLICIPLYAHDRMVGVLCALDQILNNLSRDEREILSVIATQLAIAFENSMLFEFAKKLSITDEQTNLYNHRYLKTRLNLEIQRAERFRRPLAFLMLDVDDFKEYNDTFGHLQGDRVLFELGQILEGSCRAIDIIPDMEGRNSRLSYPKQIRTAPL